MKILKVLKTKLKKFEPTREKYMFTDNRHPEKGIMSAILGALSVATLVAAVLFTYQNGGQALAKYAVAALVAALFSAVGLVLGIMSRFERDIFKLFPNLGIVLNSVAFVFVVFLFVIGLM